MVIILAGYIYLRENGYDFESIGNIPTTSKINIACSHPELSLVTLQITNTSDQAFNNVKFKIIYYDRNRNKAGEKTGEFLRILPEFGSLTKVVTVPLKAKTCECIVTHAW